MLGLLVLGALGLASPASAELHPRTARAAGAPSRPSGLQRGIRQAVDAELARIDRSNSLAVGLDAMRRVGTLARQQPEAARRFQTGLVRLARRGDPRHELLSGLSLVLQQPDSDRGIQLIRRGASALPNSAVAQLLATLSTPAKRPAAGRAAIARSGQWDAEALWRLLTQEEHRGLVEPVFALASRRYFRANDPTACRLVALADRSLSYGLSEETRQAVQGALVACAVSPGAGRLREDVFRLLGRKLPLDRAEIALGPGTAAAYLGKQVGAFSYQLWPKLSWVYSGELQLSDFQRAFSKATGGARRIHFDVTGPLADRDRFREQMRRAERTAFREIDGEHYATQPFVTSKELHEVLTQHQLLSKTSFYKRDAEGRFELVGAKEVERLVRDATAVARARTGR